jgi:hypothetical protein
MCAVGVPDVEHVKAKYDKSYIEEVIKSESKSSIGQPSEEDIDKSLCCREGQQVLDPKDLKK